jgi:hypothetical protein
MFDGFDLKMVDVGEVILRVRLGGGGPAVLLVHGHRGTHTTWYEVAPKIVTPLLVLWGTNDDLAKLYDDDVLGVWGPWTTSLVGRTLVAGHHLMEEVPDELAEVLIEFLTS